MSVVNHIASKIVFGIWNTVFLLFFIGTAFDNPEMYPYIGLLFGGLTCLIPSIGLYIQSNKDAKDETNEDGPKLYLAFLILNIIMIVVCIISILGTYYIKRKNQNPTLVIAKGETSNA